MKEHIYECKEANLNVKYIINLTIYKLFINSVHYQSLIKFRSLIKNYSSVNSKISETNGLTLFINTKNIKWYKLGRNTFEIKFLTNERKKIYQIYVLNWKGF